VERIASSGGTPLGRPTTLSAPARRVLDHPAITLTDTARWDIYRGTVDGVLLRALADAADDERLSVLVLRTGHPSNVWATDRVSAHTVGRAVDIWAVGGIPIARQSRQAAVGGLVKRLLAGGAVQVGGPQALGARSFTDQVHHDHVHLQQR